MPGLEAIPSRRLGVWFTRLMLTAAMIPTFLGLRAGLSNPEGRETLVMASLALLVTTVLFLMWAHEAVVKLGRIPRTRVGRRVMTFGASCVAVAMFLMGHQADAVHAHSKRVHYPRHLWPLEHGREGLAIHHSHVGLLPRFSSKLDGISMAPVSLIFLGSGTELLHAFEEAGWHAADRVTIGTALKAFACGVLNRPYLSAPVLPVFLDGRLHDVAFQRHNEGDTSRKRHHVRWWLTEFVCEGRQVWVATASYDAGVGISRLIPMPIHHIDPDIDAERDYIVRSLTDTGLLEFTQEVRITEPMLGKNAAGDHFFTSGTACVLA
jgi:hypothetical protein